MTDLTTPHDWAARISATWRASVEAIIETGRLLAQAKDALEYGEFEAMCDKALPFSGRTAQRLMAIAADQRLSKATHVSLLPPHWGTLYEITKLPDEQFEARVADGTIRPDMERRDIATEIKQVRRAERERNLGEKQLAAPVGKYGVILEDFEWDYEVRNRRTGMDRHAGNHYETAADAHTPEEIIERTRERFECAADDCVLWMYAPIPHLAIAIDVLRLRGFKYVSHYIWRKDRIITGWWLRAKHELLLIGVKGKPPCPAPGTQWESVIDAKLGEHSVKPDAVLEMIEQYFPTLPKIELNRRGLPRSGWSAWGNEAEHDSDGDRHSETEEIHDPGDESLASGVVSPAPVVEPSEAGAGALWQHMDDGLEIPAFLRRKRVA